MKDIDQNTVTGNAEGKSKGGKDVAKGTQGQAIVEGKTVARTGRGK